jgi:hypothetical protein
MDARQGRVTRARDGNHQLALAMVGEAGRGSGEEDEKGGGDPHEA